jgi:DNA-binding protein
VGIRGKIHLFSQTQQTQREYFLYCLECIENKTLSEGENLAKRRILPLAAMEKLLRHAGADRVSEDAKEALRDVLEDYATSIGKHANAFAAHANRKTIKGSDIRLAKKNE